MQPEEMVKMLINAFVKQLVSQQGLGVELESNGPAKLRLPQGDRLSSGGIAHAKLVAMVEAVASPSELDQLYATKQLLKRVTVEDTPVQLGVWVRDAQRWQVRIALARSPEVFSSKAPEMKVSNMPVESVEKEEVLSEHSADTNPPVKPTFRKPVYEEEEELTLKVKSVDGVPSYSVEAASSLPVQEDIEEEPEEEIVVNKGKEPVINKYLRMMMEKKASDLHMSSEAPAMARIHGEIQLLDDNQVFRRKQLRDILMEIAPEQNQKEFDETNDTDFAHAIPGLARFRANYFMDRHGIGAVFRQIPFEILSAEKLGIPKEVLDLCWLSKGLVLVTGPTGSGKSTTLATLVDYINENRSDHIITIEDPIEFVHQNKKCLVNQREVKTHTASFKRALKAALREDPDIVLVGEMRDLETISIAVETAETGHLVFGTLHTTTAPSTVDRIIDQFPPEQQSQIRVMLAESLKGVISQVLCKKKGGGRAAAYEILIANSAISNLIREGKTHQLPSMMQTGKNLGMRTMNDSLVQLVVSGAVDAKEAYLKAVDKQGIKLMLQQKGIKLDLEEGKEAVAG
jgi:twitching motility protein PilT